MDRKSELARLQLWADKAKGFSGWDLSSVRPKLIDPGPTWDYAGIIRRYSIGKRSVLDMGTGGGEFLGSIRPALPARTIATEAWIVNAPIAERRLGPIGVDVVRCKSLKLPFANSSFDLVINRHEELGPQEVARVLARGGLIVTQQVGDNWPELKRYFPRAQDFAHLYEDYVNGFEQAGLKLVRKEQHHYKVAYKNIGEIVYLLTIAPWEVPEFSVDRDLDALLSLESGQSTKNGIILTESRFLIIAQK